MPPRRHQDDAQPSLEDWWQDPEVVDEHVRQARTTGVAAAGPVRLRTDPRPQPALFDTGPRGPEPDRGPDDAAGRPGRAGGELRAQGGPVEPVSYTHLTLPTK